LLDRFFDLLDFFILREAFFLWEAFFLDERFLAPPENFPSDPRLSDFRKLFRTELSRASKEAKAPDRE